VLRVLPAEDLRPVERFADERPLLAVPLEPADLLDADLRPPVERLVPEPVDFARLELDRDPRDSAPDEPPLARPPLAREPRDEVLARVPPERDEAERPPLEDRPVPREPPDEEPLPSRADEPPSSSLHLPVSTRCAASATASAISDPSRVALDTAAVAARDVVSAASRPASRILRRAAGLALIAAAAAASPAASISRLIAAFAILSIVSLVDDEELFFLPDLAMPALPLPRKDTLGP
jgi:hypothetical protein